MELMKDGLSGYLRCPKCASEIYVSEDRKSIFCKGEKKHCYDFAAKGYLNLFHGQSGGDSKSAVRSRSDFLNTEAYAPVLDGIKALAEKHLQHNALIVDAGCGEGYYSCGLAKMGNTVFGFDLSKEAVLSASKRAAREEIASAGFGVASVFELPVRDESVDCVVNIFAPCAEEEYLRMLRPGGVLMVAYAGSDHLMGMKRAIYDRVYENEERSDMPRKMKEIESLRVRYLLELKEKSAISDLFAMTPYYWRTSQKDKEKLEALSELKTEIDIVISVFRKEEVRS